MLLIAVPSILESAMKIDCPLRLFRLKSITMNSTDIIRFCPNAAYAPCQSLNSLVIEKTRPKQVAKANRNMAMNFFFEREGNSDRPYFKNCITIRTSIKNHKFKSLKNKGGITVSIGISYSPHPKVQTHDDLISFADNALYEAKNSGRDKVIIYK